MAEVIVHSLGNLRQEIDAGTFSPDGGKGSFSREDASRKNLKVDEAYRRRAAAEGRATWFRPWTPLVTDLWTSQFTAEPNFVCLVGLAQPLRGWDHLRVQIRKW